MCWNRVCMLIDDQTFTNFRNEQIFFIIPYLTIWNHCSVLIGFGTGQLLSTSDAEFRSWNACVVCFILFQQLLAYRVIEVWTGRKFNLSIISKSKNVVHNKNFDVKAFPWHAVFLYILDEWYQKHFSLGKVSSHVAGQFFYVSTKNKHTVP